MDTGKDCEQCPDWDANLGCKKEPSKISDQVCLLRHIAITLNYLTQVIETFSDEGDSWKWGDKEDNI